MTAAFQMGSLMVFVVTLIVAVFDMAQRSHYRAAFVPPVLWSGYGVVYYVALLTGQLSNEEVLLWGSVHRFLAGMLVLGATVTLRVVLKERGDGNEF